MNGVCEINSFVGRPVVCVESANKLGQVEDLVVDPVTGRLAGFSIKTPQDTQVLVDLEGIHGIGPDAVMVERDESLLPPEHSLIRGLPLARKQLLGVKVITEDGQLLGEIRNLYVHENDTALFIYEVGSSILDKLLGNAVYYPASEACAFSEDGTRLIVANTDKADRKLSVVATRVFAPTKPGGPKIVVRTATNDQRNSLQDHGAL